jgi:hypothetical protein
MNECLYQQAPVVYTSSLAAQAAQPAICDSHTISTRLRFFHFILHLFLSTLLMAYAYMKQDFFFGAASSSLLI